MDAFLFGKRKKARECPHAYFLAHTHTYTLCYSHFYTPLHGVGEISPAACIASSLGE